MRKIKIAQIGLNQYSHSLEILKSICKQTDLFEVVGIVYPQQEKTRIPDKYEKTSGLKELTLEEALNDPQIEAVTVETDEIYLSRYALMAAKAGKHIHMEKPGGADPAEFRELIETMRSTGKVFHTGYMYRYNPYVVDLLERIKKGELGEILSVNAEMSCIHARQLRQWLQELPGGMMFYLGCHLVDLILQIQGQPNNILVLNRSTKQQTDADDFGMAVFEYDTGVSIAKASAKEVGGYARRQLVVAGTEGTVELKPLEMFVQDQGIYTGKTEYFVKAWNDLGEYSQTPVFNRYDGMMAGFASFVRGEKENPYTLDYEWELYQTVLKACGVDYEGDSCK